jgi:hypothetical protein
MKFMSIVTAQAVKSHLLMQVRLGTRRHTQEGMSPPGDVTGYTNVEHVRGLIEVMPVGESTSTSGRPDHMAVPTGAMAMRTIVVIPFYLMGWQLVKILGTT